MSDVNLSITDGQDVYLSITETPTVVTLSQAVISGALAATVTVGNVVTVNVATMPALSISSVTVSNFPATQVVSVSNLPATTTVTGTVALDTASLAALESITVTVGNVTIGSSVTVSNLTQLNNAVGTDGSTPASNNFVKIGGHQDGNNSVEHIAHVSAGGALKVDASDSAVTFGNIRGTVTVSSLPAVMLLGSSGDPIDQNGAYIPVGGFEGNPVEISGTVTANVPLVGITENNRVPAIPVYLAGSKDGPSIDEVNYVNAVLSLPAISGTVTVGSCVTHGVTIANSSVTVNGTFWQATQPVSLVSVPTHGVTLASTTVTVSSLPAISGTVTIGALASTVTMPVRLFAEQESGPSSGQDTLLNCDSSGQLLVNMKLAGASVLGYDGNAFVQVKQVSGSSITVGAMPNGALTTRFGTPTTANTAFATSAVTNASRKYLLIQNVTTGSNVITVGIGFTPTTTQGIQLAAGAGITFESSYIPTGAVQILSSVTASNFTILEA